MIERSRKIRGVIAAIAAAIVVTLVVVLPIQQPRAIPDDVPPDESTAERQQGRSVALDFTTSDDQHLAATLHLPTNARPGLPGMVLVHGAGPGLREKYRAEAEAFARTGIATLTYDKRTAGYSLFERSYARLAEDAAAAAALLRSRPEVEPTKVGLWGFSEGGWVAPLAASRDPSTAFLVVVGANGVEPLRQQVWADAARLEYSGVRGSLVDAASRTLYRWIADAGMFPEPYHDPAPTLRELTLPVLAIWGAKDRSTPPVEGAAAYREQLDQAGNRLYTLRTFADAEHSLHTTITGFDETAEFAPGYVDLVGSWVAQAAAGRAPAPSVAGIGDQSQPTSPVPPLAWYESIWTQAVALTLMLVGFAGFGLLAAVRRLRGRAAPPAPWSARTLAVAGPIAVIGGFGYLVYLQMSGGNGLQLGPLLAGRPLVWLLLQAISVVAVLAWCALAVRQIRSGDTDDRVRVQLLLAAGAIFVGWATYWGLLLP